MPDPLNLFNVLLGRSKPNPDLQPVFTPQDQAPPSVMDPAIDFVRGLGYFPTSPLPQDAGKAYGAGAMLAAGAPLAGAFGKWRPALREVQDIIAAHQADPIREALLSRVTPSKVFHRTPINPPEGFELPPEFGPNYTPRLEAMSERFLAQKEIPQNYAIPRTAGGLNKTGDTNVGAFKKYSAPSVTSPEDAKLAAQSNVVPSEHKKILGGNSARGNRGSTLTEGQVGQIKGMLEAGLKREDIAKKSGAGLNRIGEIARGEAWNKVKATPVASVPSAPQETARSRSVAKVGK